MSAILAGMQGLPYQGVSGKCLIGLRDGAGLAQQGHGRQVGGGAAAGVSSVMSTFQMARCLQLALSIFCGIV